MSAVDDGTPAVVLRSVPYREHDLIVDFLTPTQGRLTLLARGARKSTRRFGGALDQGTRVRVEVRATRKGRAALTGCDVLAPVRSAREHLDRLMQLNYVLELARLNGREGDADPRLFALVCDYLDLLESASATAEGLVAWELGLLAHLGYALQLDRCVGTGGVPDGLSLSCGGAVVVRRCPARDVVRVPTSALRVMARLAGGDVEARFSASDVVATRRALQLVWTGVTGRAPRTAEYL